MFGHIESCAGSVEFGMKKKRNQFHGLFEVEEDMFEMNASEKHLF